jgi:predicted transcriptional regulator
MEAHMEKSKERTEKVNVTCRIAGDRVALLDKLGAHYDRDRSYLVNQAVEGFLAMHEWQITEIEKALKEADAGDFATDAEVRETFRKLRK